MRLFVLRASPDPSGAARLFNNRPFLNTCAHDSRVTTRVLYGFSFTHARLFALWCGHTPPPHRATTLATTSSTSPPTVSRALSLGGYCALGRVRGRPPRAYDKCMQLSELSTDVPRAHTESLIMQETRGIAPPPNQAAARLLGLATCAFRAFRRLPRPSPLTLCQV